MKRLLATCSLLALSILLSACAPAEDPSEPPSGWVAEDDRWFRTDVDTSGMFRNLDTFHEMGILTDEASLRAGLPPRARDMSIRMDLVNRMRDSLIRMYRNRPETVDSIFVRHVAPTIIRSERRAGESFEEERQRLATESYRLISRYFRQPRARLQLGRDVPMQYPDSLRQRGIGGTVHTQVYLNEDGEPLAIEKTEGVHPVLDAIAMRATTQMRWHPAYVAGKPVPSWARFQLTFRAPGDGEET